MNPYGGIGDNNKNNKETRTKAIAASPMAGIIIAAILMSGILSFISSYQQPAIAQQNMTGTNATTTGTPPAAGGGAQSECTNATTTTSSGGAGIMGGNATAGTNATTAAGGNQSMLSEAIMDIRQACMALQNNDIQNAMMRLDSALTALEGHMNATSSEGAAVAQTMAGGEFSEEEGGRAETVEEREEGEDQSPGQSMTEEEE